MQNSRETEGGEANILGRPHTGKSNGERVVEGENRLFERHLYLDEDVPAETGYKQRRQRNSYRRETLQEAQMRLTFPGARTDNPSERTEEGEVCSMGRWEYCGHWASISGVCGRILETQEECMKCLFLNTDFQEKCARFAGEY